MVPSWFGMSVIAAHARTAKASEVTKKRLPEPHRSGQWWGSKGHQGEGEGAWSAHKYSGPKRCVWHKIHPGIDEKTLEVRAVKITGSHIGYMSVLPDLLNQIPTG